MASFEDFRKLDLQVGKVVEVQEFPEARKPSYKLEIDFGASVVASPSKETQFGKKVLKENPAHPGSLGVAISEALETVVTSEREKAKYSLGSVLNHVLLHQTIIGEEARLQFEKIDVTPDVLVGCIGGGSNFAGFSFPLMRDKLARKGEARDAEFIAVEPKSCPSTTCGKYEYDFGDSAGMTPLLKMLTLGRAFVPSPIHAGGLRYHGMAPTVSLLVKEGFVKPCAFKQREVFEAGMLFARTEGIIPAPETAHAIKAVVARARCRELFPRKTTRHEVPARIPRVEIALKKLF